ncbi:hypothetical protein GCM10011577_22740 [Pseudarthrobacter polychromogenes]|uniref:Uncharacterized protein n=1 Tax=Pseudarthrobacter polychromogenes TaxID=1676 RepID=A0ABQ1XNC6_9MICC|nr:hypothetical protein GCM10011577_22740 [Pseudarthrobacter polychromogenes]
MGHIGDEGFGQAQEPAAAGRGLPPRQRHLRGNTGAALLGRDTSRGLLPPLGEIKSHSDPGLLRSRQRLQILKLPQLINHPRTSRSRTDGSQGLYNVAKASAIETFFTPRRRRRRHHGFHPLSLSTACPPCTHRSALCG